MVLLYKRTSRIRNGIGYTRRINILKNISFLSFDTIIKIIATKVLHIAKLYIEWY